MVLEKQMFPLEIRKESINKSNNDFALSKQFRNRSMVLTKRLTKLHVGSTTIIKVKHQMLIRHERLGLRATHSDITKDSQHVSGNF